jgi:uncharacterized protein YwgA
MGDLATLQGILDELSEKTGREFDASTFGSRLRIQKSVYLLKSLGCPHVQRYSFSAYFRGPYSPDLAADYYRLQRDPQSKKFVPQNPAHLHFVGKCVARGDLFLETISTIHSIAVIRQGLSKEHTVQTARSLKPFLKTADCEQSWQMLKAVGLL